MVDKKARRFGNFRQLPSGRWQVRYRGPDGRLRSIPRTFEKKRDAERTLSMIETQRAQDDWADPKRGAVKLSDYAEQWVTQRPGLRPSTTQLYRRLLKNYVVPHLGEMPLNKITTAVVREWRATLISTGLSQTMAAKAYRLLRVVLMTAVVEDRLITRNSCQLRIERLRTDSAAWLMCTAPSLTMPMRSTLSARMTRATTGRPVFSSQ